MVKYILVFAIIVKSHLVMAAFTLGLSTNSWQEKLPIVIANEKTEQLASFSSFGLGVGYDYIFLTRYRYAIQIAYLPGKADIHKLDNTINPRRDFTSIWLSNKVHWRVTKTFSYGPNFVLNQRSMTGLSSALNVGLYLDFDFDLFNDIKLTQSLGTMSDSKQFAYSFVLQKVF